MVPVPLKVTSFGPVSMNVRKEVETNSKFSIESRYLKCPLGVRSTLMVKLRTLPSMLPPPVTFIAGPLGGGGGGGGGGGAIGQEPIQITVAGGHAAVLRSPRLLQAADLNFERLNNFTAGDLATGG